MEAPPNSFDALFAATLKAALEPAVREAIADVLPEQIRRALAKPYYSKAEAGALLSVSSRQLEYLMSRRQIEFVKNGRTVLFPAEAVHEYLDKGRVTARS